MDDDAIPAWVSEASSLPVAFAQVREDPLVDSWVAERLPAGARVALIASGGCTAAALAPADNLAWLHLVDANPAQLALARLKLGLLATCAPAERLALLGHRHMAADERARRLTEELHDLDLPADALGPPARVAELGPDHAGRYERLFAALRDELRDERQDGAADIAALLRLHEPAEQARRVDASTALGRSLDRALDRVMSPANLVRLFGEEATRNPVEPFARHFAARLRRALALFPADTNPYLWQMLEGRYPDGHPAEWLSMALPGRTAAVTWSQQVIADELRSMPAEFDFVHLSNVLDWLAPEAAARTLELTGQALRPGGWTVVRQLNSTLDIRRLGPMFEWLVPEAEALHRSDRSFFYRALHVGRRR